MHPPGICSIIRADAGIDPIFCDYFPSEDTASEEDEVALWSELLILHLRP